MQILTIDTTTPILRVGVCVDDVMVVETAIKGKRPHAARLASLIEATLEESNLKPIDLDGIALTIGPGSYTGIRLGVSIAKGMAYAGNKWVIGVNTLDAMLFSYANSQNEVVAAIDARGGRLFAAWAAGTTKRLKPQQIEAKTLASKISEHGYLAGSYVLCGNGAPVLASALAEQGVNNVVVVPENGAISLLSVTQLACAKHLAPDCGNVYALEPWYGALTQPERLQNQSHVEAQE